MDKLSPLICPRCGGTVNRARMICEYCGTPFDDGTMHINLTTYPAQTQILGCRQRISKDLIMAMHRMHPDDWTKDIMEMMSREMARKLIPFIEMETENHPETCSVEVSGKLRVLPPDYRF